MEVLGPGFVFYAFLFPVVLLGVLVLGVVAIAGRRGADPRGRRVYAVYLLAVMFVTLFTFAGAASQIASAPVEDLAGESLLERAKLERVAAPPALAPEVGTIEPESGEAVTVAPGEVDYGFEPGPDEEAFAGFSPVPRPSSLPKVLQGIVLILLAGPLFGLHLGRFNELMRKEASDG